MSGTSFQKRSLDVIFQLGTKTNLNTKQTIQPTFNGTTANQVKLTGLRMSAAVQQQAGISQGALDLRIYGMRESVMNDLFVIVGSNSPIVANNNRVTLLAGQAILYDGAISSAAADYAGVPDVAFSVQGLSAYITGLSPAASNSFRGSVDAATIMANLARQGGFNFENNGVSVQLNNPYFWGDLLTQMEDVARAGAFNMVHDGGTIAIWPNGGARGGAVPLISSDTGLIGYPRKTSYGVELQTLYNPAITFGAKVQVQSKIPTCCGIWSVNVLTHNLESEIPNGAWFSTLQLIPVGFVSNNAQVISN